MNKHIQNAEQVVAQISGLFNKALLPKQRGERYLDCKRGELPTLETPDDLLI